MNQQKMLLTALAAAALFSFAPCAYSEKVADGGLKQRAFSFRGGDRSSCRTFLLTEAAVLFPLKPDLGHDRSEQNVFGSVDLGAMVNVGGRSAVGASGFWESGSNHNRGGVRLRYRHWLSRRFSLELSPGIVVSGDDNFKGPGFIGQAALNAGDLVSVVVEGEVDRYLWTPYTYDPSIGYRPGPTELKSDTTFRVGLRGGSYVGAGAAVAAGVILGAVASSLN